MAEQIKQGRLKRRNGVNRDPQVECLKAASGSIAIRKPRPHAIQNSVISADRLTDDKLACILERLPNLVASWHLAESRIIRAVFEDYNVSG